jgi:cellulose 1,4-beta-cellobiosidase
MTVDKASGILRAGVSSGYPVAALTNGTTYAFAVSAVNGAGESVLSAVRTAVPVAP